MSEASSWVTSQGGKVTSTVPGDRYITWVPNSTSSQSKKPSSSGGGSNRRTMLTRASGGYTGEWAGSSTGKGIPAILHEKEFVLNKGDTENFVSGINTIRDLASVNGSIEKSIMQAVLNTASQLGNVQAAGVPNNNYNSSSNETSNIFNITAEFPNANNVDEIKQAILTLPTIASQLVNSNLK